MQSLWLIPVALLGAVEGWQEPARLVLTQERTLVVESWRFEGSRLLVRRDGGIFSLSRGELLEVRPLAPRTAATPQATPAATPAAREQSRRKRGGTLNVIRSRTPGPAASVVPRDGRGEAYWRGRASALLRRVARAQARELAAAAVLEDRLERSRPPLVSSSPLPPAEPAAVGKARERLARARLEREAAERELAALREQARRAGAWPGWLR